MTKTEEMAILFGQKLEKLMQDKQISANKLSQEVGIDRASIGKYLKGEGSPRIDTFLTICDVLQVQPNYFLNADYNDYSVDDSRTEERKLIESLYILCKNDLIEGVGDDSNGYGPSYDYGLSIYSGSFLQKILTECLRYAGSDLADDVEMCKKIADKYEPLLIEHLKKKNKKE